MINVLCYDDQDPVVELSRIKLLVDKLQHTIMDSQLCHIRSDSCQSCKFKEICFDCEELEVWAVNQITFIKDQSAD